MRVAIYARYSSENQSGKSIDDQIRVCKDYIKANDMTVDDKHIYIDEAISGSIINRPGLQALEKDGENKEFEAVLVDDLSRLSRSNHQMLTLVLKFNYLQVKIISVSDGIITDDDNSKLGIHIRGLMNELYLDDLKKKTMRGLEGQKLRGFSAGEKVYGYSTHPVGELKINKKGQPKYDGMVHKINPEEADIVKRIHKEFVNGASLLKISRELNEDKIPTKRGYSGGWNRSSISRILKNEKYMGLWIWKKYKNVKDPMTGRIKRVLRPEKEWLSSFRQELAIINKEEWQKAQKRWEERKGAWPVRKTSRGIKQKSYIYSSPIHLLSGLMKCQCCGGAIVTLGGKGGGYYGCYNARRKTCKNMLLVSRKRIEHAIISELKEKILTLENFDYVYKNVEKIVASGMNEVPELIKKKKAQHDKISLELQNYLNYIRMGNISKAVSEALKEAETKSEALKDEIGALEFQKQKRFKAPPKEWVSHRLENLHQTLSKNTSASSLALKDILGTIQLEPISEDKDDFYGIVKDLEIASPSARNDGGIRGQEAATTSGLDSRPGGRSYGAGFKPYYVAHTKIQTLVLLDDKDKGSNWSRWWRRRDTDPFISKMVWTISSPLTITLSEIVVKRPGVL